MMRPLEWLFCFTFIPTLLIPFIPFLQRPKTRAVLYFPIVAMGLHWLIEGWRVQLVPLYLLALLIPVMVLGLQRQGKIAGKFSRVLSVIALLLTVVGGVGAGWVVPMLTLPTPTGPYAVGVVHRELRDESRNRRLMVSVWYPASTTGDPAFLTHNPEEVMTALGNLTGIPGIFFQHLHYARVAAAEESPVRSEGRPFPVLVFSHGMVGLRLQNSPTFQDLASHGYVVVAVDHTDAAAVTVFPDGETRFYDLARFGIPPTVEPTGALMNKYVFPVWVADQQFAYDTIEDWAMDDPLFSGALDITQMGSFGHSFGGATSLEVCRIDPRCKASINLDGGLYGETEHQPAVRPLLLMTSTGSNELTDTIASWDMMVNNATADAYWLELSNSNHLSFTLFPLLSPLLPPPNFDPNAGLQTMDTYIRHFFDIYVRGIETPPLQESHTPAKVRWVIP